LLLLLRVARFRRYVGNRARGSLLDGGGAGGDRCIELARYSEVSGPLQARGFSQPCRSARRCVVYGFRRPGMAWNQLRSQFAIVPLPPVAQRSMIRATGLILCAPLSGLPPGFPTCRRAGLVTRGALPGFRLAAGLPRRAGQRRASLPIAAGPCAGQRRASGRHSGSASKRARGCLARANRKPFVRLRPSLPCAWGIDNREEGT